MTSDSCTAARHFRFPERQDLSLGNKQGNRLSSKHGSVQQPEGDAGAAAAVDGRQRRDDLAGLAERFRQPAKLFIEVGKVEADFDRQDVLACPDVLEKTCSSYSVRDFLVCSSSVSSANGSSCALRGWLVVS